MGIFWPSDRQEINSPGALIFDMDGVLIDSEGLHERAKRQALLSAGINIDEALLSQYTGRSDRAMITDVARTYSRSDSEIETILAEKNRLYALSERELTPVPGSIDFLHWAHGRYRLALATSATARNRESTLSSLGLTSLFEVSIDASLVTHSKPSPEVFEKAISRLGLARSDCWIIEDATNGIAAAKLVPCFAVALTTSFGESDLLRAGADVVVDRFDEIRELLGKAA